MKVDLFLAEHGLFSFETTAQLLDDLQGHLENVYKLESTRSELITNLCRLSTAEIAVLDTCIGLEEPSPPKLPIVTDIKHAKLAIFKTDSTPTLRCPTAEHLPTSDLSKVFMAAWSLFTADGQRVWDLGSLYENENKWEVINTDFVGQIAEMYSQSGLQIALDMVACKVPEWQAFIWKLKLAICLDSSEGNLKAMIYDLPVKLGLYGRRDQ